MPEPITSIYNIAICLGVLSLLGGLIGIVLPGPVFRWLQAFPRHRLSGLALTALCVCWSAWILYTAELGRFVFLRPAIPVVAIITFSAVVYFLNELLAARALGGVLMLLANPILNSIRWVDSNWRLVITVLMYAWVVFGIILMLSPWQFRKCLHRLAPSAKAIQRWSLLKMIFGAFLIGLAFFVFS